MTPLEREDGFSLIELVVAMVILTIGVLGLAGMTAVSVRKVTVAQLDTERAAALQTVVERLRALPFDSLRNGSDEVGEFDVDWTVESIGRGVRVRLVTTGPGLGSGGGGMPSMAAEVPDTFSYVIHP